MGTTSQSNSTDKSAPLELWKPPVFLCSFTWHGRHSVRMLLSSLLYQSWSAWCAWSRSVLPHRSHLSLRSRLAFA